MHLNFGGKAFQMISNCVHQASFINMWSIMLFRIHEFQTLLYYYTYFRVGATEVIQDCLIPEPKTSATSHSLSLSLWVFAPIFSQPWQARSHSLHVFLEAQLQCCLFHAAHPDQPGPSRSPFLIFPPIPGIITYDSQNPIWTVSTSMLPATLQARIFFFSLLFGLLLPSHL